jgi:hypothetical protein
VRTPRYSDATACRAAICVVPVDDRSRDGAADPTLAASGAFWPRALLCKRFVFSNPASLTPGVSTMRSLAWVLMEA